MIIYPCSMLVGWHHQMQTFSALLAICAGNSLVIGEFPAQRPVTRNFDVFFDLYARINGWVNNPEAGDLRRHSVHYDVTVMDSKLIHVSKRGPRRCMYLKTESFHGANFGVTGGTAGCCYRKKLASRKFSFFFSVCASEVAHHCLHNGLLPEPMLTYW